MAERCCNESSCRRKKPIKLMRSDLTGTWYVVTDYTKAKHGDDTWRATTKHEVEPQLADQLEAMRDAGRRLDVIHDLHHAVKVRINHSGTAGTPDNWPEADYCAQCGVEMPCPTLEILTVEGTSDA